MPFREIAESTYDWESWISPEGKPLWINVAVERLTGFGVTDCLAHSDYPLFLIHPDDRPAVETLLTDARQGGSGNHYEFRILRKDGAVRWGAISWQPLTAADGTKRGYRSSVRDIHDRKRMEAELRRAVTRAEESNRAKTVFLANISHELKTPLQSILGYAELLAEGDNPKVVPRHAARIVDQARSLDQLVNDLLDFSSLQAGGLTFQMGKFASDKLVESVLQGFWPLFEKKGVDLVWETSPGAQVCCEKRRVTQIINNLVGNALKFTQSGRVHVRSTLEPSRNTWTLVVDDTGPGVKESERKRIFSPFHQEDATPSGVGLGLAISRHLARSLGGDLWCEASPHGGARFVAKVGTDFETGETVPLLHGSEDMAVAIQNDPEIPLNVLVVDDVDPAREFLQEAMSALGCICCVASSAKDGYALAEELCPELILLDIQMPDVDGWAAAQVFRKRLGNQPFIVAMSASGGLAAESARLKTAGFDGFSLKPLALADLRKLILLALTHRDSSRSTEQVFDRERWSELGAIKTSDGETLLERMKRRVGETLPAAIDAIEKPDPYKEQDSLARALHQAAGLLALIGARQAYAIVADAEGAAEQNILIPSDTRVRDALAATRHVLSVLQATSNESLVP